MNSKFFNSPIQSLDLKLSPFDFRNKFICRFGNKNENSNSVIFLSLSSVCVPLKLSVKRGVAVVGGPKEGPDAAEGDPEGAAGRVHAKLSKYSGYVSK